MICKVERVALIVLMLASLASGQVPQTGQGKKSDQDEPLKLRTDLVTVNASVVDRQGHAVKDLTAGDFSVFEDGVKQRVEHFQSTEGPFTIMLLLDLSGSTRNDLDLVKGAAMNFVAQLRPDDKVGVVIFSKEVELVSEIGDPRGRTEDAVRGLKSESGDSRYRFTLSTGTSFYDAIYLAAEEPTFKKAEGRKAIICMSDGVDSTSQMDYAQIAKPLERSGSSAYFLELNTEAETLEGLLKSRSDPSYITFSQSQIKRYFDEFEPDSIDRTRPTATMNGELRTKINTGLYKLARRQIRELSERAGGRAYSVRSLSDLDAVYKQVADDLRSQYLLGYYPENSATDGRWRNIRVAVKPPTVTVRARSGYWAPGH